MKNLLVAGFFSLVTAAYGQSDLSNASLEQLMNIAVTSVNKKEQKLARTAAAERFGLKLSSKLLSMAKIVRDAK